MAYSGVHVGVIRRICLEYYPNSGESNGPEHANRGPNIDPNMQLSLWPQVFVKAPKP